MTQPQTFRPPFGVTESGYIRRLEIKGQAPPHPLREALRRLSAEGFVEVSPYQGAIVSQLDLGDMRDAGTAARRSMHTRPVDVL